MKPVKILGLLALFCLFLVPAAFSGGKAKLDLKTGDSVYVCGCGDACPCQTMDSKAGKCTCGKDLVKATVVSTDKDSAVLDMGGGKKQTFKTVGQYVCACGESCPCTTISQAPGKCTCGTEMKKAQ